MQLLDIHGTQHQSLAGSGRQPPPSHRFPKSCGWGWIGLLAISLVPATLSATTALWTGGDLLSGNWTAPNNWARSRAPIAGDDLTFPAGAARLANNNNFAAGTVFNGITFSGSGYHVGGNVVVLNAGLSATYATGSTHFSAGLTLASNQTISAVQTGAVVSLQGVVNLNGKTLTVAGNGVVVLSNNVTGSGALAKQGGGELRIESALGFSGSTTVEGGTLRVNGTLENSLAMVNHGAVLAGTGTVDGFSANGGIIRPGTDGEGTLHSKSGVNLLAGSIFDVRLNGTILGLTSGQLTVTGGVQLAGCTLNAALASRFLPQIGDSFTIIRNDGVEPIAGTFAGLPEGAHLTIDGQEFLITYTGGTGNDVVLIAGKPRWSFTIIAGVSHVTSIYYGGLAAVGLLISNQIATVNHRFNDPGVFDGYFEFKVTSVYEFSGDPVSEIAVAHPNHDFKIVYDGFPTQGGGWYGNYLTIHHSWWVTNSGGLFGGDATDGIVHEFGHSRGAIDMYGLNVASDANPINHQSFNALRSIMNYPYGERLWDEYSRHLINKNTSVVAPPISYITDELLRSVRVRITDLDGTPFPNVQVNVYPVPWFSSSVSNSARFAGVTGPDGVSPLPANPFGANTAGSPWNIQYPNFLVEAKYQGATQYAWLPLYQVALSPVVLPIDRGVLVTISMSFTTFDTWRLAHFTAAELADNQTSGDLADPDGDGISNLMEYALGLDPHHADPPHVLNYSVQGGYFAASYTRRKLSTTFDLSLRQEMAKSLDGPWILAPSVQTLDEGSTELVQFREALPIRQSTGAFYRLQAVRLP